MEEDLRPSVTAPPSIEEPQMRWKLALALLTVGIICASRFVFLNEERAKWLIRGCGYWMIAGTAIIYGFFLWKRLSAIQWSAGLWRSHRAGLVCLIISALFLQAHEERGY